jgi:MOSC domain-containing protein YiiM
MTIEPTVVALHLCPGHRLPMRPVTQAQAVADLGFVGDAHAKQRSRRQLLLMSIDDLNAFGLRPGDVRENIAVAGLDLMTLAHGQRLCIGDAVLEMTYACEPCERMDELRPGLRAAIDGRRGMLARVVASGLIRAGDRIVLVAPQTATTPKA